MVKDRVTWHAAVHWVQRVGHNWANEQQQYICETSTTSYVRNLALTSKSFAPPSLFIITFCNKNV